MRMTVALFDFDGTLTCRDSLVPYLRMAGGTLRFALAMLLVSPLLAAYALRLVRNDVAKEALLRCTLGGISAELLHELGEQFAEHVIPTMLREDMQARLSEHQAQGHCCILVSASLDAYLEPWAKSAGFDYCIATSLAVNPKGLASGKLEGANCHGQEKVRRIERLFGEIGLPSRIYAYGDTAGDIPMLAIADEGYWVKGVNQPLKKFENSKGISN